MNPRLFLTLRLVCCGLFWLQTSCATSTSQVARGTEAERLGHELTVQIAEIMAQNHVYETAVPLLREGIAEDPNNPRLHRLLGTVLRDRGVADQALSELQLSWELNDTDAETAAALGVLYDSTHRPVPAEIWHRHALDLAPKRGEFFNNLGFSLYLQGRDEEALAALLVALRYNPNQVRAFNNLGFCYFRLGHDALAFRAFQQANKRAQAIANMGVAFELKGDVSGARRAYRDALLVDRHLEAARDGLKKLAARSPGAASLNEGPMPWDPQGS